MPIFAADAFFADDYAAAATLAAIRCSPSRHFAILIAYVYYCLICQPLSPRREFACLRLSFMPWFFCCRYALVILLMTLYYATLLRCHALRLLEREHEISVL